MKPTAPTTSLSGHRVLITGGAGFIATHLAQALAPRNELVLFDTGFDGRAISFTPLRTHKNVQCVTGDIMDPAQIAKAADGCDTIVHMAQERPKPDAAREPDFQQRNWDRMEAAMKALDKRYDRVLDSGLLGLAIYFDTSLNHGPGQPNSNDGSFDDIRSRTTSSGGGTGHTVGQTSNNSGSSNSSAGCSTARCGGITVPSTGATTCSESRSRRRWASCSSRARSDSWASAISIAAEAS